MNETEWKKWEEKRKVWVDKKISEKEKENKTAIAQRIPQPLIPLI